MTTKLEEDLALGGMAVSPSPQPLVLWQMLLAHENAHLQAHLASSPASLAPDGPPSLCYSCSLISAAPLLPPLIPQTLLSSALTVPPAFLLFLWASSALLPPQDICLCSKPAPPLGQLQGPHVSPAHVVVGCPPKLGGDGRMEEGRVGCWLVTPLRHWVPCCMVIGRWGWFSSLRDKKPDGWRESVI